MIHKVIKHTNNVLRHTKRVIIFVIGVTVLLFGFVLLFTPGPAIVVIPIGLAILATEFLWAEILLHKVKKKVKETKDRIIK
ncbi:PGPGW domain-containing protein [Candidatus Woesearchaeota archaeon]|nr:PGPGW domain-containing protein [Candidatus Woesearchaeota archaeon]